MKIILGDDDDDDDEDGDDDDDAFQVVLKRVFDLMGAGSQTHEVTELLLLFSTTQQLQQFSEFIPRIFQQLNSRFNISMNLIYVGFLIIQHFSEIQQPKS